MWSIRWLRLVITSGSTSLAKPGSMPLTCRLALPSRPASSMVAIISSGSVPVRWSRMTGPLDTTFTPSRMKPVRSSIDSKTRSSVIAPCTMQSGRSAISSSRSVVALTPSSRPSSASSPASTPFLASVDVHTPTSSRSGWASTPAMACLPMVPVDQTTTRSGFSGITCDMGGY